MKNITTAKILFLVILLLGFVCVDTGWSSLVNDHEKIKMRMITKVKELERNDKESANRDMQIYRLREEIDIKDRQYQITLTGFNHNERMLNKYQKDFDQLFLDREKAILNSGSVFAKNYQRLKFKGREFSLRLKMHKYQGIVDDYGNLYQMHFYEGGRLSKKLEESMSKMDQLHLKRDRLLHELSVLDDQRRELAIKLSQEPQDQRQPNDEPNKEDEEFKGFIQNVEDQKLDQRAKDYAKKLFEPDKKKKEPSKEIVEPTRDEVLGDSDVDRKKEIEDLRRDAQREIDEEEEERGLDELINDMEKEDKKIIEPTREDMLASSDADSKREMKDLQRYAKQYLEEQKKKEPSGKDLTSILSTFSKRKRGPGSDHARQYTAPEDETVSDVDTAVPSVGAGDSAGEGFEDYFESGFDYAKAAGVTSKSRQKKEKKPQPPKKDTSRSTVRTDDKKQDASKKVSDERVVALLVKTDEVTHNGKKFLKLVDISAASCVVRRGSDEIMYKEQEAVNRLISHGFFVNVPGVGLVATNKYSGFGGYTDSYFEHAKEDAGKSYTKTQECLLKLGGCLKKCTPEMRARVKNKSLSQLSSDEYWCRLCWKQEDDCRKGVTTPTTPQTSSGEWQKDMFDIQKMSDKAQKMFTGGAGPAAK